jgi:hypothetical protein
MSEDQKGAAQLAKLPRELVDRLTKPFVQFLHIEAAAGDVACNTIHGFGQDVERAGEKTQAAADAVKRNRSAGLIERLRGAIGVLLIKGLAIFLLKVVQY